MTVTEAMVARAFLCQTPEGTFDVTDRGREWFRLLGIDIDIDIDNLRPSRRPIARCCLDGTERRFHLGGPLGVVILERMIERGWVRRPDTGRSLFLTETGARELTLQLGLDPTSCVDGSDPR